MIEQIEEAIYTLSTDYILIDGCDGREVDRAKHTALIALSTLKKIVGGDDWFDIESAPRALRDGTRFLITDGKNTGHVYFECGYLYASSSNDPSSYNKTDRWKHISGAKHIEMLMEREMKDD